MNHAHPARLLRVLALLVVRQSFPPKLRSRVSHPLHVTRDKQLALGL